MQISFLKSQKTSNKPTQKQNYVPPSRAILLQDTVSFGSIKKKSLSSFQLACANFYKAPLEKFNSDSDLESWAEYKVNKLYQMEQSGRTSKVRYNRSQILEQWKNYLQDQDGKYCGKSALTLIIYDSLFKDLKANSDRIPPVLSKNTLDKTVNQLEDQIKKNPKTQFDFLKEYKLNLIKDCSIPKSGWVKIPSFNHDKENFMKNAEKLAIISSSTWCTKNEETYSYLFKGDFYVYMENYEPKVGIRIEQGKVQEIQGVKNDCKIPQGYINQVEGLVSSENLVGADNYIKKARGIEKEHILIFKEIGDKIDRKDYEAVLNYFNIDISHLENGSMEFSQYHQPSKNITFKDLGIDERLFFGKVSKISGNADFSNSSLKNLGELSYIGGSANFSRSLIEDLGQLTLIQHSARFNDSRVESLNNVEFIGGDADFTHSEVADLGKLKTIKGSLWLNYSPVSNIDSLEYVGGDLFAKYSIVNDFSKVRIGGELK